MKLPLIKIKDIVRHKTFILTDQVPIFDIYEKNGSLAMFDILAKDDSPYSFAPGTIEFVDIRKILEIFIAEEVSWLNSKELNKESEKLLACYDKLQAKMNNNHYEKNQHTIEELINRINMDIDYTDSDVWEKDLVPLNKWDFITQFGYKLAQTITNEGKNLSSVAELVRPYEYSCALKEICIIYYKYLVKSYKIHEAKEQLLKIKKKYCDK